MEVREVDPSELEIDPLNERNENVGPHDPESDNSLEESIREQGLIQPPVARRDNQSLKIIVGQRRTLAAQAVGLDRIPVVIVDWDDSEALQATITENADVFQKEVSKSDRAKAISKLLQINKWNNREAAEHLGVSEATIRKWTERTRDEWEDTTVHVDPNKESEEVSTEEVETDTIDPSDISKEKVDQISDSSLESIRRATTSSNEREEAIRTVVEEGLNDHDIREAKKRAQRGEESFTEAVETINKEKEDRKGQIKVQTRVTFTGDYAEGLRKAAKEYGTSEEAVVREAIKEYLSEEGYI